MALKFGLHISGQLRAWQQSCVKNLEASGLARLSCIIRSRDEPSGDSEAQGNPYVEFVRGLDLPSQRNLPASVLLPKQPHHDSRLEPPVSFNADSTAEISAAGLDFILSFCTKNLAFPLTTVSKYGVWYFVFSDISNFDSPAPCFWEIYYDHDVTGAALLKLVDNFSAGIPLRTGYFPTNHTSFARSVETFFDSLLDWPTFVCREITQGAHGRGNAPPTPDAPEHYGFPTVSQVRSLKKSLAASGKALQRQNRFYYIDWNIGRLMGDASSRVTRDTLADVSILCRYKKGQYVADPCLFVKDERPFVFCELYLYGANKGVISAFEINNGRGSQLEVVIEEPFHLSYPQVFEYAGSIYCMPESAHARQVNLYEATNFPFAWKRVHTLLDNVAAVDSTLLRFENKWWLFFTDGEARRFNTHLHIWQASDLLGDWKPHIRNPVKIDVRSARPAGQFFWHKNCLYRPAQDCSRTYGGQLRINKIVKLSESEFEESIVTTIAPPVGGYCKGIHTLSSVGDYSVVDVKRYAFKPSGIVEVLKQTAKDTALKLGVPRDTIQLLKKRIGQ